MRRSMVMGRLISVLCCVAVLSCVLAGCGASKAVQATDLMSEVEADSAAVEDASVTEDGTEVVMDFSVRLFQNALEEGENVMISPVSVLTALAMTANGAKDETLAQMEEVFGFSVEALNEYLYAYRTGLPSGEKYQISMANSIWFTEDSRFTVVQDFLQSNANYYGAEIYQAAFDQSTLDDINRWVSENTDGMIEKILDEIPSDDVLAVMYLINAIAFDAEWEDIYKEDQVREGIFTTQDGDTHTVDMMYSEEELYLEDENAVGFVKYYVDRAYAFVALLPNEGLSVEDYVASLTGAGLSTMLEEAQELTVYAAIPEFESEYSVEMSEILKEMGMTDAFDEDNADFSGLGSFTNGNIFINRVLHKTYIAVDEKGTKAGAATAVEIVAETALEWEGETRTVYLDRPFVYLIIDCEENIPIFIGTVMDIDG